MHCSWKATTGNCRENSIVEKLHDLVRLGEGSVPSDCFTDRFVKMLMC